MTIKMFVLVWRGDMLAYIGHGTGPADAVRSYYDRMDSMCAPQDEEMHEEFSVDAYEIPDDLAKEVSSAFDDLIGDDAHDVFEQRWGHDPRVVGTAVDVLYKVEGAEVSEP